ncbi:unnamed protein product, partial [marine sediment metagenome]
TPDLPRPDGQTDKAREEKTKRRLRATESKKRVRTRLQST